MSIATTEALNLVAVACLEVNKNLTDPNADNNHVLKKTTDKGQESFRFTQIVNICREKYEVQVRKIVD